jgi:hypothetical protein
VSEKIETVCDIAACSSSKVTGVSEEISTSIFKMWDSFSDVYVYNGIGRNNFLHAASRMQRDKFCNNLH